MPLINYIYVCFTLQPSVKLPAETHIRFLHPVVKDSIIKELSHFKINGEK